VAGTGTIHGATVIGTDATHVGVLNPGDNGGAVNGKLTLGGGLTLTAGSQIQMNITSTGNHDSNFVFAPGNNALQYLTNTPGAYNSNWSTPTGDYDTISIQGSLNLNGSGVANYPAIYVTGNTTGISQGDIFKLLDWASVGVVPDSLKGTGNLEVTDLLLPALNSGLTYDTSAFTTYGVVVVVPEPGRVLLLLVGLLALGLRRRRRE
jgi:hypothetical protein